MSDIDFHPGELDVLRQLFLDGPTGDGDIVSKSWRASLILAGYVYRANGFSQLTPAGLTTCVVQGMGELKERRARARAERFIQVSDDSAHHYVIPVERHDDWDAWVEQLGNDEADYDLPAYAHSVEGGLSFADPVENETSIAEAIRAQLP